MKNNDLKLCGPLHLRRLQEILSFSMCSKTKLSTEASRTCLGCFETPDVCQESVEMNCWSEGEAMRGGERVWCCNHHPCSDSFLSFLRHALMYSPGWHWTHVSADSIFWDGRHAALCPAFHSCCRSAEPPQPYFHLFLHQGALNRYF